jgi:ribosomal-protein-alanine N-acetyltransferase
MTTSIPSERLDLIPMTPAFLRASLECNLHEAEQLLQLSLPAEWPEEHTDVLSLRLKQLEAEPALQPWLLRPMVMRETGVMVGHIGFHTAPGAEYLRAFCPETSVGTSRCDVPAREPAGGTIAPLNAARTAQRAVPTTVRTARRDSNRKDSGAVEFGFTVFPDFRRQGYAREASLALMHWARQTHGVTKFILSIRPDNTASQALAARLGFVRIGSHLDEVDGLEDVLECKPC